MLNLKAGNIIFGDPLCHDTLNGIRQRHISLENKSFGIYFTVNHARQIARLIPASSNVTNVANRSLNQFERKDVWRKKGRAREPMINFAPAETAKISQLRMRCLQLPFAQTTSRILTFERSVHFAKQRYIKKNVLDILSLHFSKFCMKDWHWNIKRVYHQLNEYYRIDRSRYWPDKWNKSYNEWIKVLIISNQFKIFSFSGQVD